jgi:hypothetical protein
MSENLNFSNSDVNWDASLLGIYPIISDSLNRFINNYPSNGDKLMLEYLKEDSTYVLAHVVLCSVYKKKKYNEGKWNGLSVTLKADGTVEYEFSERAMIENLWIEFFKNK